MNPSNASPSGSAGTFVQPTSSDPDAAFDECRLRLQLFRLQNRATPLIQQVAAMSSIPHPAVMAFNSACEDCVRADHPGPLEQALKAATEAVDALERVLMPPPAREPEPLPRPAAVAPRAATQLMGRQASLRRDLQLRDRLSRARLEQAELYDSTLPRSEAQGRLLAARLDTLTRLDKFATAPLNKPLPTTRDCEHGETALTWYRSLLGNLRHLLSQPDPIVACLVDEERRLAQARQQILAPHGAGLPLGKTDQCLEFCHIVNVQAARDMASFRVAAHAFETFLRQVAEGSETPVAASAAMGSLYDLWEL